MKRHVMNCDNEEQGECEVSIFAKLENEECELRVVEATNERARDETKQKLQENPFAVNVTGRKRYELYVNWYEVVCGWSADVHAVISEEGGRVKGAFV